MLAALIIPAFFASITITYLFGASIGQRYQATKETVENRAALLFGLILVLAVFLIVGNAPPLVWFTIGIPVAMAVGYNNNVKTESDNPLV